MIQAVQPPSSASGVTWDLSDLYQSVVDPRLTQDLETALERARAFETAYRGKIDVEGGPAAATLLAALTELESLFEQMDRPAIYAQLLHAARTDDPRHGALLSRTLEQRTLIKKHLTFFELEWVKVDHAPARSLLQTP